MNRSARWIVLFLLLLGAVPLAAAETLNRCVLNCLPGKNACSDCCFSQFDTAKKPCYDRCKKAQKPCLSAAFAACKRNTDALCISKETEACFDAQYACQRNCEGSVQIAGGCPGEVPPQKCPYNCQSWNSASRSCVGALSNACGSFVTSDPHTSGLNELMAAREQAAAAAAAAHTETLKTKAKTKSKAKK